MNKDYLKSIDKAAGKMPISNTVKISYTVSYIFLVKVTRKRKGQ